jgi:nucleoid-associated protein YgaU
VTGHTLWGISQKYYGDGSRYQVIYAANSNQIRSPSLIYPGQVFVIPKEDRKP